MSLHKIRVFLGHKISLTHIFHLIPFVFFTYTGQTGTFLDRFSTTIFIFQKTSFQAGTETQTNPIAIADALKRHFAEANILFIGAKGRMEMERVPKAGYPIEGLWISGMTKDLKSLLLPLKLVSSLTKARRILKRFKPDVVIGVGGFASGPTLKAANWLGIPTVIQEQNSYPGKTNRNVGKKAKAICVAYDHLDQWFPAEKIHYTGNPLRANITLNATRA